MELNEQELLDNLGKIAYTLDKAYISRLEDDYGVLPFDEEYNKEDNEKGRLTYAQNIRAIKVKKLVYDKEENELDCLKNVLTVFAGTANSVALLIQRNPQGTEMYFVLKNEKSSGEYSSNNQILLKEALEGNFPGADFEKIDANDKTKELFNIDKAKAISLMCSLPSEKSEDYTSQRIEKLLNGIIPKKDEESYTVVILAEALKQMSVREILSGYEEIATAITPFVGHQFQMGENKTETTGEMESLTKTIGTSHSVNKTHNVNIALNASKFSSNALSKSKNFGASFSLGSLGSFIGGLVGGPPGAAAGYFLGNTINLSGGGGVTNTVANGTSGGMSAGYGYSWGTTDTESESEGKTQGTNHSISLGTNENTTYTYKSYMVADMLEKVEKTIKRINESQSEGLWQCATYVLAQDSNTGKKVANFLRSITQGDESHIEPAVVQSWIHEESNGMTAFNEIRKYIKFFSHPIFVNCEDGVFVSPVINLSTQELSKAMAFPKTSVQGLPVISTARFGRNVINIDGNVIDKQKSIHLGKVYHMHKPENTDVRLDIESLAAHTFITGSTGSGKSRTIYHMLSELKDKGKKFFVIEPAKGEYKKVFKDATTYGTNPQIMKLLRINPFSFPKEIHIYEHLDRLVEIFNACWPMYAAMPAVLKDAIERAYIDAGWDLQKSENEYEIYPTFADVLYQINTVMEESKYSADSKGDYIGALSTRIKSLTNGINGMIFTNDELSDNELFDKNVIVDLSRVGSMETKALIMGLLVMKLQEYHMSNSIEMNSKLKHVTVLEEAHNLLKCTSTEQSSESSNLMGKSVEMLANAIAEMRTYGEGFIIADQSPGLMDMSVIRNTNTKIIMRLPDYSDRELVGKAAGLNDEQIVEIAKLKVQVAAVYQNNWIEPVLCEVSDYPDNDNDNKRNPEKDNYTGKKGDDTDLVNKIIRVIVNKERIENIDEFKDKVKKSAMRSDIKKLLLDIAENNNVDIYTQTKLVDRFFNSEKIMPIIKKCDHIENLVDVVRNEFIPPIECTEEQLELVLLSILQSEAQKNIDNANIFERYVQYMKKKVI